MLQAKYRVGGYMKRMSSQFLVELSHTKIPGSLENSLKFRIAIVSYCWLKLQYSA